MSNRIRHYLKQQVHEILPELHECYRVLGVYQKAPNPVHEKAMIDQLDYISTELQVFKEHLQHTKQPYFDAIGDPTLCTFDRIIALDIAVGAMHIEFPVSRSYSHQESEALKQALGSTRWNASDDDYESAETETSVSGIPASGGTFTGKVRIVTRTSEYKRLPKNTVVVSKATRPEVILGAENIGAIVTEQGGSLCHAAIVARELGIPCVVGAGNAMGFFRNGQFVTVDGDAGIVRISQK